MDSAAARSIVRFCGLTTVSLLLGACAVTPPVAVTRNQIIISVRDQKMTVVRSDHTRVTFPISTSKFGLGDRRGTYETPTGEMAVAAKIGGGAPVGAVFHGRVRTGEIVKVDAPGRDAIVSRILALRGLERSNQQAFSRGIYIHGTPEERNIGRPTSYGCIRMRSKDVIALYDMVKVGARVQIIDTTQSRAIAANIVRSAEPPPVAAAPEPAAGGDAPAVVASSGNTSVVRSITTADNGVNRTTTTTVAAADGSAAPVTRTTTTQAAFAPPVAVAPTNKKEWSGSPNKLLARQAEADARAKQRDARPPVGAPTPARPVSNDGTTASMLHRSALDSL